MREVNRCCSNEARAQNKDLQAKSRVWQTLRPARSTITAIRIAWVLAAIALCTQGSAQNQRDARQNRWLSFSLITPAVAQGLSEGQVEAANAIATLIGRAEACGLADAASLAVALGEWISDQTEGEEFASRTRVARAIIVLNREQQKSGRSSDTCAEIAAAIPAAKSALRM